MKTTVEQAIPTDLGTFRKFLDEATRLVGADMTAQVSAPGNFMLRICATKEFEEEK